MRNVRARIVYWEKGEVSQDTLRARTNLHCQPIQCSARVWGKSQKLSQPRCTKSSAQPASLCVAGEYPLQSRACGEDEGWWCMLASPRGENSCYRDLRGRVGSRLISAICVAEALLGSFKVGRKGCCLQVQTLMDGSAYVR